MMMSLAIALFYCTAIVETLGFAKNSYSRENMLDMEWED